MGTGRPCDRQTSRLQVAGRREPLIKIRLPSPRPQQDWCKAQSSGAGNTVANECSAAAGRFKPRPEGPLAAPVSALHCIDRCLACRRHCVLLPEQSADPRADGT